MKSKDKSTNSAKADAAMVREMLELYTMVPPRPLFMRKCRGFKFRMH